MNLIDDPQTLAAIFGSDRETHLYGLADLEEPFWSNSTWYQDGDAVVGLVSAGESWVTLYAMSRRAPEATIALLTRVQESAPSGTWVTGPMGLYSAISEVRRSRAVGTHWRMILDKPVDVDRVETAVSLTMSDRTALEDLHASDPGRAFFLPGMLAEYPFVGVWEQGRLVASAGTHAASRRYGVAAIGAVITRPSHRGRGLGTVATAALCRRLVDEYETIGLNVEAGNEAALRIYDRLGFRRAFQYEEIELL